MATKGKGRILEGQIAFEFYGEIEQQIKPRKEKAVEKAIIDKKEVKTKKVFRKTNLNVKPNHLKKNRKVRKSN